ncbi:unnamed protein product, partial [Discosporangium mesarthrocarpum]
SVVRVLIDVAFTCLYFLAGVKGWLSNTVDFEKDTIEVRGESCIFKSVLVPFITAAPLWWRFQQNLRRSYETGERWPHLGNALKYATAMSVSLFGTFRPGLRNSKMWVFCFVFATLYQYCWDIFMDWNLIRW